MPAAHATIPDNYAAAGPPAVRASHARALLDGLSREWRRASWVVRLSVSCLLLFYFFAAASPFIAPYDPIRQYRDLPDCPPMRLHLARSAEWAHGFFYAHPMRLSDAAARIFAPDRSRKTYLRILHHGHLFTTESADEPYFVMGSDGLGRDLF
jgi:peptide/nickel transport system permease protein